MNVLRVSFFGVVAAGLALAACSVDREVPEGSAASGGGGGAAGGVATEPHVCASGGALALDWCSEWLGPEPRRVSPNCGLSSGGAVNGGEGGQPHDRTVLREFCQSESGEPRGRLIVGSFRLFGCLDQLALECDPTLSEVKDCLAAPAECVSDAALEACASVTASCPGVPTQTCTTAFMTSGGFALDDSFENCFRGHRSGEDCESRFFRCAWGI